MAAIPAVDAAHAAISAPAPPAPAAPASLRSRWESFWSGASSRRDFPSAVDVSDFSKKTKNYSFAVPLPLALPGVRAASSSAAPIAVPAPHGFPAFVAHASPFLGAGAVLVAAYFADRGVHALLNRLAESNGMDRQRIAAVRLVASAAIWTGAVAAALNVGGASPEMMTAVFGAGGTILTLGLREILGNVIQGVSFLVTRPYSIGTRLQIDEQAGILAETTITNVLIRKDDGAEVNIRHAALAGKSVIVFGTYAPESKLPPGVSASPKLKGALGAFVKSLDFHFLSAAAVFAALLVAPGFLPLLAAGWAAATVHYALAVATAWLTWRADLALTAAMDQFARENSWRRETAALARLVVGAVLWTLGGGAGLRLLGVSWAAFGASLGLTTLGVGLASNNFFGSIVQRAVVLFSKPFQIDDRVQIGVFPGIVADMTFNHVVLKLDEERYALVPYALARDAAVVVTPKQ